MIIYTKLIGPHSQFKLRMGESCIEAAKDMKEVSDLFKSTVEESYRQLETCPISTTKMLIGGRESFAMRKDESLNSDQVFRFFHELRSQYRERFKVEDFVAAYRFGEQETYERVAFSILDQSFNKDSAAIKATCKALKIKHTYKAIQAYLRGEA